MPGLRWQTLNGFSSILALDNCSKRKKMKLDQVLRLIVVAIVLMVAFSLLAFLLQIGSFLLSLAVKILVVLLLVAVVLRFIDLLRGKKDA